VVAIVESMSLPIQDPTEEINRYLDSLGDPEEPPSDDMSADDESSSCEGSEEEEPDFPEELAETTPFSEIIPPMLEPREPVQRLQTNISDELFSCDDYQTEDEVTPGESLQPIEAEDPRQFNEPEYMKEPKLPVSRVKRLFRDSVRDAQISMTESASTFLTDVCTEFVQLIALAGLDRSETPKSYVDANGVLQALRDLGFDDIADEIPDLSVLSEDGLPIHEQVRPRRVNGPE
jgi:hypothetical protein